MDKQETKVTPEGTAEVWKWLKYEGYEVSNLGRIRSYWRPDGLHLDREPRIKSIIMNNGRAKVSLHYDGRNHLTLFGRIMAEAFLGDSQGRVVLYRDDDPSNCSLSNIYYATKEEAGKRLREVRYQKYGYESTIGKRKRLDGIREQKLDRALRCKQLREQGLSYKEIGKEVGISESGAYRIVAGSNNQLLRKALERE